MGFCFCDHRGCFLLADGVITPSITIVSAVEGLININPGYRLFPLPWSSSRCCFLSRNSEPRPLANHLAHHVPVVLYAGTLGMIQILQYPSIIKALDPHYAYIFLTKSPHGFVLLGAVFLCTTGAEALIFRPGALRTEEYPHHLGLCESSPVAELFRTGSMGIKTYWPGLWVDQPFLLHYALLVLITGIIIATLAAIIASQALISGSYTWSAKPFHWISGQRSRSITRRI